MAEVATEPTWLEERRRQGASLTESLPLPDQKAKGWEFTDLSGLDIDSYAAAVAVAVDPAGGAVAVWSRSNGTNTIIQSASRPAAGAWQAVGVRKLDSGQRRALRIWPRVLAEPARHSALPAPDRR